MSSHRRFEGSLHVPLMVLLVLAMGTSGCSPLSACHTVEGSCLDLEVQGPEDVVRLRVEVDGQTVATTLTRSGLLSLSSALPRHLEVTPPPGLAPQEIRTLRVTGYAQDEEGYAAVEQQLSWPEGTKISAVAKLPSQASAPTITKVDPDLGPSLGGQSVRILGSRFASAVEVTINGQAASSVVRVSDTEVTAVVPAQPGKIGKVDVSVRNTRSRQTGLLAKGYTYFTEALEFATYQVQPVEGNPTGIAAGDFNNDGKIDLAVTNRSSKSVSFLAGNGDGTYAPRNVLRDDPPFVNLVQPTSVVSGDFNNDGISDIVVASEGSGSVTFFPGSPNGLIATTAKQSNSTAGPIWIVAGDLDKDGNLDLVVAASGANAIGALKGRGDGTFVLTNLTLMTPAREVALADLNEDGLLDIVSMAGSMDTGYISTFINRGGFTFNSALNSSYSTNPRGMVIVDTNGDGKLDLVSGNGSNRFLKRVRGVGDGSFSGMVESSFLTSCFAPVALTLADLNKDQRQDLLVTCDSSNSLAVHYGLPNGSFTDSITDGFPFYAVGEKPSYVLTYDANKDGWVDAAVVDFGSADVAVLLGEAPGRFRAPASLPFESSGVSPAVLALEDFDGDGQRDVLMGTADASSQTSLFLRTPGGGFKQPINLHTGAGMAWFAVGKLGSDNKAPLDLVYRTGGANALTVKQGGGNGMFILPQDVMGTTGAGQHQLADLNGDGKLDLFFLSGTDGFGVALGRGDRSFATPLNHSLGVQGSVFTLGDLNADGKIDCVVLAPSAKKAYLRLGNGDGTFKTGPIPDLNTGDQPSAVVIADVTGENNAADGKQDVVIAHAVKPNNQTYIYPGLGDGSFQGVRLQMISDTQAHLVAYDLNGDRRDDLVSVSNAAALVFLAKDGGGFQEPISLPAPRGAAWAAIADMNGDLLPDIVVARGGTRSISVFYNRSR